MSFRNRLALFLIVTLIAVQASTALFAYAYLRHDLIERGKSELTQAMGVFQRQLDFLSERVTDGVEVLSLDYALRSAIARSDRGTELSAMHNHGNRIGATRMMLVGLDGNISVDTAAPDRADVRFPFADLLSPASDEGTALATLGGRIFWIVVVPVRAPVPIAYIAAWIPVDDALLEKFRAISSAPHSIALATVEAGNHWVMAAHTNNQPKGAQLSAFAGARGKTAAVTTQGGYDYLTVTAPLVTAAGSKPVVAVLNYPLNQALAAYRGVIVPMLMVLGLALLVALVGAALIVRRVSRPLEALAATARRIAAGDYTPPARIPQRDEVGHLTDALINMTGSIAERENALRNAIEATEMARGEAVRANEAKSQFLANMSHELRTPLNAIVGFSEMLEQQVLGPIGVPRYLEYARDIHGSGEHLLHQLESMFDLAEAEAHRLAIARRPVGPGTILEEAAGVLLSYAEKQRVHLTLPRNLQQWPQIDADAVKLRQAFSNLIHNAIKFTPPGGAVSVKGHIENGRLNIRIEDTGVGIEADALSVVMRPFHRLRSALDGQHQGAGLGLPFAKVVIELHGGSLTLESVLGVGTTVTIALPVQAGAISEAA
ncbi:MAG: ATP-binding protein [Rhizomicrobium sp.]|jgi:signal transduction histidine kinase